MATLTTSTAFTIALASTDAASTDLEVVAVGVGGVGNGRLIHPTLGTYDYPYMPNEWTNLDGDAIIRPDWQTAKTLSSGQAAVWDGNIRDVTCTETWLGDDLSLPMDMLRLFIAMWMNPPDPTDDYVQWWPNYITAIGFDVAIIDLQIGGSNAIFTDHTLQGWCDQDVTLTYQLRAYAS